MSMDECLCLLSVACRTVIDRLLADGITAYGRKTVADVPADPTTSKDLVLRTGYQLLRSKIEGR